MLNTTVTCYLVNNNKAYDDRQKYCVQSRYKNTPQMNRYDRNAYPDRAKGKYQCNRHVQVLNTRPIVREARASSLPQLQFVVSINPANNNYKTLSARQQVCSTRTYVLSVWGELCFLFFVCYA